MQHFKVNLPVFVGSVAVIALFVGIGVIAPKRAELIFSGMQTAILSGFGWLYLLSVAVFLFSMLFLAFSRYGELKLGPDDSEPEFRYLSWIAMLFAAGMGIGLMYFAVGEPMTHFASPPEAEPLTIAAQREAMSVTFFHWGGARLGDILGRRAVTRLFRLPLQSTPDRPIRPLPAPQGGHSRADRTCRGYIRDLRDHVRARNLARIRRPSDKLRTELSVGDPQSIYVQLLLVTVVTAIATISVVTGVEKGVRILSETNLFLAVLLMLFVLVVGPTGTLMRDFVQNIGLYLDSLVLRTFNIYAYEPRPWIDSWTLFYWAWWISWSPFVGMFIARISRGRTVREFVTAVLFVPAMFTFLWMTVFGNTAIYVDTTIANGELARDVKADLSVALFQFFEYLPWPAVTSTLAVLLVSIFFVTSSDSGSLVIDTIASGGETATPALQRIFWCSLSGIVAAVLLSTGGLTALQSATISTALPFSLVMLILVWSLFVGMRADLARTQSPGSLGPRAYPASGAPWQRRLAMTLSTPDRRAVEKFLQASVLPALEAVARELTRRSRPASVGRDAETGALTLTVPAEGHRDFVYGVQMSEHKLPAFTAYDATVADVRYEARTFFSDGSRGYDIMGMADNQIINDVLFQFERYTGFVRSPESSLLATSPEER